jgi:Spy/CpxP family protein refolding chaperone
MMTKLIVIAGFVIAFGAGVVTGLRRSPQPVTTTGHGPTTQPRDRGPRGGGPGGPVGMIARELQLTPEQITQMREIWSEVARLGGREQEEQRRQIRKERDEAIVALIRAEDRPAYEKLQKDTADRLAALEQGWRDAYQKAVEQTKPILTAEQRTKYEELITRGPFDRDRDRDRGDRGGPGGARGGGGGPRGGGGGFGRDGDHPPIPFLPDENRRAGQRATTQPASDKQ